MLSQLGQLFGGGGGCGKGGCIKKLLAKLLGGAGGCGGGGCCKGGGCGGGGCGQNLLSTIAGLGF